MRILLLIVLMTTIAEALPMYNPAGASLLTDGVICTPGPVNYCDPWDSMSFNIGFTGWYVQQHPMLAHVKNRPDTIHDFSYRMNGGYLSLNICDCVEAFSAIGGTNFSINYPAQTLNKPSSSAKLNVRTDTSYSLNVGGKWSAWECGNFLMGLEVEYFGAKSRIISVGTTELKRVHLHYNEWQISGGGSYRINISGCTTALLPYAGIHYSRTHTSFGKHQSFIDEDGDRLLLISSRSLRHVGYSFGATLVGCNKIQVTAEATFISETAFLINSTFRF